MDEKVLGYLRGVTWTKVTSNKHIFVFFRNGHIEAQKYILGCGSRGIRWSYNKLILISCSSYLDIREEGW